MSSKEIIESLVYDVPTAGKLLNLSRATAYSMAAQGFIPTIRFGKRVVVPKILLEKMLVEADRKNENSD
jgi:excisionase family DNA binding protein